MMNEGLDLLSQLGKRIAYLRKSQHKSQLDLSLDAGIAKNYLSDIERGRRNPSITNLSHIAEALGVTLETLFKGISDIR